MALTAAAVHVEMILDLSCPWCFIGKRQLDQALALRPSLPVSLSWRPFLLAPDMPREGLDRTTYLLRKFGSETRVSRIYDAIARVGASVGIAFAFDRIRRTPNTVDAHRLVALADRYGRANDAVELIYRSYFLDGRDIGDRRVLLRLGAQLGIDTLALRCWEEGGVDATAIHADNGRAHRLGINGVPAFVFDRRSIICGAQDPQVLARMLDVARVAAG